MSVSVQRYLVMSACIYQHLVTANSSIDSNTRDSSAERGREAEIARLRARLAELERKS
jgi:hypothetical protein